MIDPSKDKFAYFKDNIQTAEDKEFDASQYYYHREDLTGKSAGGAAGVGAMGLGGVNSAGSGNPLNLSGFQGMTLSGGADGSAQQGVFGGFHSGGMMGGNSFLGGASRGPMGSGMPVSHELHRMNSSEHLMKGGRSFQLQTENKTPDMSDFPALGSRSNSWLLDPSQDSSSSSSSSRGQSSEFVIQKEDFPALSSFGPNSNDKNSMLPESEQLKRHSSFTSSANDSMASQRPSGPGGNTSIGSRAGSAMSGVHVGNSGVVRGAGGNSNVTLGGTSAFGSLPGHRPSAAVANGELDPSNQYGLLGMLHTVIRPSNDAKKNLMMGSDLTSLGLNLNSAEPLHPVFASPWAEGPLTKEPQFTLPNCYYNQPPALKTTHLSKFHLETLFFIFYSMPRDVLQAYAAQELYSRDWRYHGEQKMWLKRATPADAALFANGTTPSVAPSTPSSGSTIGSIGSAVPGAVGSGGPGVSGLGTLGPQFLYFDTTTWERRVFTGNIHSISAGLLGEDEIRVKFTNATS